MSVLIYIESIDSSVFLGINHSIANPLFDVVFPSLRELTYVFWFLAIAYFWFKKEKKLALLMAAGIVAGALFTYPVKLLVDRQRPYEQLASVRVLTPPEPDPSFPSGHTEMSFLTATVVSRFHPEYSKYLYAFSFVVALSRVYVGVHFPGDAVGGVLIGVMIGRFVVSVAQRKSILQKEEI